jgi:hypothetical protein
MRCRPFHYTGAANNSYTPTKIDAVTVTLTLTLTVSPYCLRTVGERADKNSECTGCWRGRVKGHRDGHGHGHGHGGV